MASPEDDIICNAKNKVYMRLMQAAGERQIREAEHFDRLAEETGEIWWGSVTPAGLKRLSRRAELVRELLSRFQDPFVLEIGCGTGALTRPLLELSPNLKLCGIDISPRTIASIRERLAPFRRATFEVADSSGLSYPDSFFDAAVGNSVLHHVPLQETVREMYRVLKPGGIVWFSEPNMMNPQIALEKNVRFIGEWLQNSPDETAFFRWPLRRVLQKAGFVEVDVRPFDFLHPSTPQKLVHFADRVGKTLERIPLIKEIAGSLEIRAVKPRQ